MFLHGKCDPVASFKKRGCRSGFTLIELLIVVAIIAILAAIAVPNFMEAQVRSKVSRSKADLRMLATALETYCVDNNGYPTYPYDGPGNLQVEPYFSWAGYTPRLLTTPIAYTTSLPQDAFMNAKASAYITPGKNQKENPRQLYQYEFDKNPAGVTWEGRVLPGIKYVLIGVGPDLVTKVCTQDGSFHNNANEYLQSRGGALGVNGFYDATNGTKSSGDIVYHGPGLGFDFRGWLVQ